MRSLAISFGMATAFAMSTTPGPAQTAPATVDGLVSAAKDAAGTDWAGTFLRLCVPPSAPTAPAAVVAAPGEGGARTGPPARRTWHAEPARVADNLYFLGTRVHNAWALVGSEGIILFEALYAYAAADEILDGLKKLGLDTGSVKYILISHAHSDHDGGAKLLQDSMPGARLVYGAEDWETVDNATNRPGGKPRHDLVGADGMRLSVGDATVQIVTMPGHTPGTLSYLFEARDSGRPLRIVYVGGTAVPFDGEAAYYDRYAASSAKLAKAAADFGATVVLSNHSEFDNAHFRAHTAAHRRGLEANPFDVGRETVDRYFTVVEHCVSAARLRSARQAR